MTDMQNMLAGMVRYTPVEGEDFDMVPDAVGAYVRYDAVLALQDPVAVHANMLRGTIAKPSWANILHLYPTESAALVAANWTEGYNRGRSSLVSSDPAVAFAGPTPPTDATAALARMLADARAEGYAQAQSDECGCRLGEDCAICDARAMKGDGA